MSYRYGLRTTTLLVVASMVGTGVFTTSGVLLARIPAPSVVLLVWGIGGLVALAGALSYAELAASDPKSGGEYSLLARSIHPAVGFVAGVISIVAGFAAPIAACAIAFARYLGAVFPDLALAPVPIAIAIVLAASAIHARGPRAGARFQDAATIAKIALIGCFLVGGALRLQPARLLAAFEPAPASSDAVAVGLVLVSFAYSGWNAGAYVAGELERPAHTLPRALLLGTLLVTALYVALNAVFLASARPAALAGVVEIGHVAAVHLFGEGAARVLSAIVALGLVATIGALTWTGTRVYDALGRDHPPLRTLARRNAHGAPTVALAVQALLSVAMVASASYDVLLGAVGFTLSIGSALTVIGLFLERRRRGAAAAYRVPLYPFTPALFVAVTGWTIVESIAAARALALAGLAVVGVGLLGYALVRGKTQGNSR